MIVKIGLFWMLTVLLACYARGEDGEALSRVCLGCICEAASNCNVTVGCNGEVCGPFRITWAYWADGGKPTLNDEPPTSKGAYAQCVTDPFCAAQAVQGYMAKFGKDCNNDGVINCDDYVRIHRLGGYGCGGPMDSKYEKTYNSCMKMFQTSN